MTRGLTVLNVLLVLAAIFVANVYFRDAPLGLFVLGVVVAALALRFTFAALHRAVDARSGSRAN